MESNEEYLLRVLHRTNSGLQDSLIPAHGAKLTRLVDRFERTDSIVQEVQILMGVQGFTKCAIAMKWLLERTKRSEEEFAPEQFESDVLLLNEKLFEAFLNQPFDMPDFGQPAHEEVAHHPVQEIQMSADEFIPQQSALESSNEEPVMQIYSAAPQQNEHHDATQSISSTFTADALESALASSSGDTSYEGSPSLADAMSAELYEALQRFAHSASEIIMKMPGERVVATAVMRVSARNGIEAGVAVNNLFVIDFYQAVLTLIAYADEKGKIKSDGFAEVIRDVGDRLANALQLPSGGVTMLKNITKFISDPKGVLSK